MRRRVFVAVTLPPQLQEQVLRWQGAQRLPVRWIAGKNLHITLVPPWYEEDIEQVRERLRRLEKHVPFGIALSRLSFGPDASRPRLIWATGPTPKRLLELQEHVESCLGVQHDRPLKLHVTVARFRPEDFRGFTLKRIDEGVDWRMTVSSVVLMESHLSKEGAEYEVLEEFRFSERTDG